MKNIYSTDNRIYKHVKALETRKYRDKTGCYLIEGPNLLEEAVKCGVMLEYVIFRDDCKDAEALTLSLNVKNEPVTMPGGLFQKLSQTEHGQGVLGVAYRKECDVDAFFRAVGDRNIVILDRLQDPGNIGTIIRTADAAGYGGLIALKGTGDIYAPKVIRAATGSVFRLPVLFADTPQELIGHSKRYAKTLVASCMNAETPYYDLDMTKNIALVIGNEGSGIDAELIQSADVKVRIPMNGDTESLNAAVAAGILMYESVRKSHNI